MGGTMRTTIGHLAFAAAALAGCVTPEEPDAGERLVMVVPDTANVLVGGQIQLAAASRDTSELQVTGRLVTWSSENPAVATVSATGVVTGLVGGEARVRAVVDGHSGVGVVFVRTDAGQIRFAAVTTGLDLPRSYYVTVDGGQPLSLDRDSTATSPVLGVGDHSVFLDGVAINCRVSGENPRVVHVGAGETATVTFEVACRAFERIAFAYEWSEGETDPELGEWTWQWHSSVAVMNEDGSALGFIVADGGEPAWSPNGARIAFTCGVETDNRAICVVNADGTGFVRLTSGSSPTWSPDGSKIAFVSIRDGPPWLLRLYTMNADGTGVVPLSGSTAGQPAWSPDGSRIAFDCVIEADNLDICTVNADGTGLVRLTSDPARDGSAAWSPDGARIAFATSRYGGDAEIAVMQVDGGAVRQLTSAPVRAWAPAWSPDGGKLAFTTLSNNFEISVMNTDGTGLARLVSGTAPTWRPAAP